MKRAIQGWRLLRDDPLRRAVNETGASCDQQAYLLITVVFSLLLICKTWLREGLPRLALLASTHSLLAALMAALIAHKKWGRQFYVSYRELFGLVLCLHCQWTVRLTALHGGVNTIDHHGGSALGLLGLLAGHTTVLYGVLYVLYARPLWLASGLVLGCMAATSLWSGERMCRRVLESPGVEAPLGELVNLLGLANSVVAPPFLPSLLTGLVQDPMQQCQAVSAWLVLAVGLALPLALLRVLERRTRRQWRAAQLRRQNGGASGLASPAAVAVAAEQPASSSGSGSGSHAASPAAPAGPAVEHSGSAPAGPLDIVQSCMPLQLYLLSSTVWLVACGLLGSGAQL